MKTEPARQAIINKMTNWQSHQASRMCKGKWDALTIEQLNHFASLRHWKGGAA